MYAGHYAIALGAKGRRPTLPLIVCLVAATASDLVMAVVDIVTDGTRADAYSHSLPAVAILAVAGWLAARMYLADARDAWWVAALVASHLPADWVTSRLALWPNGPVWGAGMYAHPAIDFPVESVLVIAGWAIYRRSLPPAAATRWLAWVPLGVLLLMQGIWFVMSS